MTDISFDRLRDVPLRDAWKHEANDFTPWLAGNIEHIAEAIGLTLEVEGVEVSVGGFYADIIARSPQDDRRVLIENQLEKTDHSHLGQILTYLAGLDARVIVWIAPDFHDPHLSAIRWLNQHTSDDFSFFALRLRVVQIAGSPFAPIFEVVERPSNWERFLKQELGTTSEYSKLRSGFWIELISSHPEIEEMGVKAGSESNKWLPSGKEGLVIGLYIASRTCGIYIRGISRSAISAVAEALAPFRDRLEKELGVPMWSEAEPNWLFTNKIDVSVTDTASWGRVGDWMVSQLAQYRSALSDLPKL